MANEVNVSFLLGGVLAGVALGLATGASSGYFLAKAMFPKAPLGNVVQQQQQSGTLQFQSSSISQTIVGAPNPDNKAEQAYRRNGFGDIITSVKRREAYWKCYRSLSEDLKAKGQPAPEGKLTFSFHVGEDGSKISQTLILDEIENSEFSKCIEQGFDNIRFYPPPFGINRHIAHELIFKTEETMKKEELERKDSAPFVVVTPGK